MAKSSKLVDLLNQVLRVEYSLIVHYPRLASAIEDEEIRLLVVRLGLDSMPHADAVVSAIRELGGQPDWSIEPFPRETTLVKIFQVQLEREKLALKLHGQNSDSVPNWRLKDKFRNMAKDEEAHILVIESILSRLSQQGASG